LLTIEIHSSIALLASVRKSGTVSPLSVFSLFTISLQLQHREQLDALNHIDTARQRPREQLDALKTKNKRRPREQLDALKTQNKLRHREQLDASILEQKRFAFVDTLITLALRFFYG
jgi:hypothetical protein